MQIDKLIIENYRRHAVMNALYDPLTGEGSSIARDRLTFSCKGETISFMAPHSMLVHPFIKQLSLVGSIEKLLSDAGEEITEASILELFSMVPSIRFDHDFEYWAYTNVKIQDKETKLSIPFRLNRAQRKLLHKLEEMRLAGKPIRIILLKARQWGGSTLTQIYMCWIQNRHKMGWHSSIVTDVEEQARNIRNMYANVAKQYPSFAGSITLTPYAGSSKSKFVKERECIIGLGSAQRPDSLRSFDFAMLHLSEVGLWKDTAGKSAADLAQSLQATVPNTPLTIVVMESTAKGVGNYFHRQWQLAEKGGTYQPVFIAWYEIERYQMDVPDIENFILSWGEKEWYHWNLGATIEAVYWYKTTQEGEGVTDWAMCSEYPSTSTEAFQSTGRRAFAPQYVLNARATCCPPSFMGDLYADSLHGPASLDNIEFKETTGGRLWIWEKPDFSEQITNRYCLFADIGGRTEKADYSVIKVIDRYWMLDGGVPSVVAVWYGHLDQDLFAWKCAQLASYYNEGLLAIESNSLKKEKAEGNHFLTVLDKIAPYYKNLYTRDTPEDGRNKLPTKYGFHTNISTKPMIIDCLNANLRDSGYIERDQRACDEMDYYEIKPDGSYGAIVGQHDDHVMTTAGANWISSRMPIPVRIQNVPRSWNVHKRTISEATI